jgi:hypothetical protein
MSAALEFVDGFPLGLQVPQVRPMTIPVFADKVPVLSKDNIAKILGDTGRVMGRDRFDPQGWIKNQGQRGSCNAYAGCAALERARDLSGKKRVVLGPEYLYAQINGGRDQGSMLEDGRKELTTGGCPPKEYVKYESYLEREQSPEATANAGRFRIAESWAVQTEEELATALALGYIGVVAVHVTNAWMKLDGDGVAGGSRGPGNHAICVHNVRIKNGVYQFDSPGSWGLTYGDKGHCWTTWERHYSSTVNYHQFYVIRAVESDPVGDEKLPTKE